MSATVTVGRREGKVRAAEVREQFDHLAGSPNWRRWLRHHTAVAESVDDVMTVAAWALARLPGHPSEAECEEAVIDALARWREKKRAGGRMLAKGSRRRPNETVVISYPDGSRYAFA